MDYKKKSLSKLNKNESYEEIDTRLASGWYVDALNGNNKKKYKTKEVVFKISKKSEQVFLSSKLEIRSQVYILNLFNRKLGRKFKLIKISDLEKKILYVQVNKLSHIF